MKNNDHKCWSLLDTTKKTWFFHIILYFNVSFFHYKPHSCVYLRQDGNCLLGGVSCTCITVISQLTFPMISLTFYIKTNSYDNVQALPWKQINLNQIIWWILIFLFKARTNTHELSFCTFLILSNEKTTSNSPTMEKTGFEQNWCQIGRCIKH